ncbi:MAG: phosphohistidine phosphatase SixA [Candidatus Binataceae bacterium]|jgi:phosphohistidine phosphatase
MMLYVLRHARAEDPTPGEDDSHRGLTQKGTDQMREAAAGMRAIGLKFDTILTSPLVRAVETSAIVADAYDGRPEPQILRSLVPSLSAEKAAEELVPFCERDNVLIVGHEPQLGLLVSLLLTGDPNMVKIDLKKGGCVALERLNWMDHSKAELIWMMTQKQLRKMRKNLKGGG